jgi:histidinol-phosphate aminotransferase
LRPNEQAPLGQAPLGQAPLGQAPLGDLRTRVHGGPDVGELTRLGLAARDLLDFSVNVNPYGAAPGILRAIREARLDQYPDDGATVARRALGEAWGVDPARICVGNGAAELLWALVQFCCRRGDSLLGSLLIVEPTFVEPELAARAIGVPVHRHVTRVDEGFAIDIDALVAKARATDARSIYLTSPQNPTGRLVSPALIAELARALGAHVTILLDEAFLALSHGAADADVVLPETVVRIRSLTKEHALPGLRVGALIGSAALVAGLATMRPAWTVSAPALAAAEAAATHTGFVAEIRARWLADAAAMRVRLEGQGFGVLPSDTVFMLVEVDPGVGAAAADLRHRLLTGHNILVRDCASFGLPNHIRLCARAARDVDALMAALAAETKASVPR